MKRDLAGRGDIELLIVSFYDKVKTDPEIGFIFSRVNWEQHLPVMFDFWENALFYTGAYTGNMVEVHKRVHNFIPLNEGHFKKWLSIFTATVDELFEGPGAELAKQRALSIATILRIKISS